MEKLFIADDENSIREGLKQIIDWESLGFALCGEAANGKDALSQILALDPALVVLDVKMPGLHGTEVIRLARESGFSGKCIILSGYSDFKYAQEAMKNGVRFYLTKPIDEDELYQTVSQIRDELAQEKQDSTHLSAYKNRAKSSVLREVMTGTLSSPLSADTGQAFGLDAALYQVVLCENLPAADTSSAHPLARLLQITDRENTPFEHLRIENRDALLLKGEQGLAMLNDLLENLSQEEASCDTVPGAVFLTYGRPVSDPEDIHLSYEDAAALLARRFFCPPELSAVGFEALRKIQRNTALPTENAAVFLAQSNLSDYAGRLCDCLSSYNRRMIVDILQELERALEQSSDDIPRIRLFLIDLFLQIKEKMTHHYPTRTLPFSSNSEVIAFIHNSSYLYEILRFFSEQFEAVMGALGNTAKDTILYDVLFYIDHHFRENIKLEAIAPLFGYNSAYLGKIFTKNVGETFNSYVDHRRIERSRELLLENNLKVYEIAEQVGYKNVDYFHKKFRKYVGMSPAEFRKRHGLSPDSANPFTPPPEKMG